MGKIYALKDIAEVASQIEEKGKSFYENAADIIDGKASKKVFSWLAKEETKHAQRFRQLAGECAKNDVSFSLDEEAGELLDTFMRGLLFPDISELRDSAARAGNDKALAAVKIGMDVEMNTIIFYQKLKELAKNEEMQTLLKTIILEEERHLLTLKSLRLDIDPLYAGSAYGKLF